MNKHPIRSRFLSAFDPRTAFKAAGAKAAAVLDEAFLTVIEVEGRGAKKAVHELGHEKRVELLDAIAKAYDRAEFFTTPDSFFVPPEKVAPRRERVTVGGLGLPEGAKITTEDLSWGSDFVPHLDAVRTKFLSRTNNRTAHARLMSVGRDRPWVVLVHGYMGGQWSFETRQWRVGALLASGLNVALFMLPFHARRSDSTGLAPIFPSADPRFNNEAFAQAVFDLRALVALLYEEGAPHVGVMGMSLGGFTTSLVATIEKRISFAAPVIPLASIADFAHARGRLGRDRDKAALEHQTLERAIRVVSPLARPLLVPKERVLIVAADGDRITPIAHARRIADHFGAEVHLMHGGHLLQVDRKDGLRAVVKMLRREGILPERKR